MLSTLEPTVSQGITEINGVSLLTREGKPRSRYSGGERLRILGATQEDLDATLELFAPRRPYYAITRSGSDDPRDWTTARGRLRDSDVLKHLVGDLIPGQTPRWVAPKAWETTQWIGIDVDYRGDRDDYRLRCRKVEKAFYVLGVPERAWLVSETPSGGRHYRFFLSRHIRTKRIPEVLACVGLHEAGGQIEIFPRTTKGMRLPFGCIPHRHHDPGEWLRFIRDWMAGEFPRVNWLKCVRRAERYAERQREEPLASGHSDVQVRPIESEHDRRPTNRRGSSALGVPRWKRNRIDSHVQGNANQERYLALLSRPCSCRQDAEALWELGIQLEGTRLEATKRLAWHLIRVRRLSRDAAGEELCRWVYETGSTTSKDVKADIRDGTNKVEQQTRGLVDYCANLPRTAGPAASFSGDEVDAIVARLREADTTGGVEYVEFALRFLRFAKQHGQVRDTGWECQIAVRGIMRKWPKCSGMRYKPKIEYAIACGLVTMTREKRQTSNQTGRPRTYLVSVPVRMANENTLSFEDAVAYARAQLSSLTMSPRKTGCEMNESDTYGRIIPPLPPEKKGESLVVAAQGDDGIQSSGAESNSTPTGVGPLVSSQVPEVYQKITERRPQPKVRPSHRRLSGTLWKGPCSRLAAARLRKTGSLGPLNDCPDEFSKDEVSPLSDFQRLEAARYGIELKSMSESHKAEDSGPVHRLVEQRLPDRGVLFKRQCQCTGQPPGEYVPEYLGGGNDWIPLSRGGREEIPDTS